MSTMNYFMKKSIQSFGLHPPCSFFIAGAQTASGLRRDVRSWCRVAFVLLEEFSEPQWVYWVSLILAASKVWRRNLFAFISIKSFYWRWKYAWKCDSAVPVQTRVFFQRRRCGLKKEDKKRSTNTTTKILVPEILTGKSFYTFSNLNNTI